MKVTFRRCTICAQFHNHLSCPYCGGLQMQGKVIDVNNGREMIRAIPLPRAYEPLLQVITRINHNEVVSRFAR